MTQFTSQELIELEFEFEFDIDPGYPGSRVEPYEPPSVENVRAFILGEKGLRIPVPDELLEILLTDARYEALMTSANDSLEQALCDRADNRRDL